MTETNKEDENNESSDLSTPWGSRQSYKVPRASISDKSSLNKHKIFLKERTKLHETYILEQSRNKRFGLTLAFLLILFASLIVLFAPAGRETISYWIGAALIIFAGGTVGFGRVWGKAANISFGADQDQRDLGK
jgi:hypothetical protein